MINFLSLTDTCNLDIIKCREPKKQLADLEASSDPSGGDGKGGQMGNLFISEINTARSRM
jgi:hypothetical protein